MLGYGLDYTEERLSLEELRAGSEDGLPALYTYYVERKVDISYLFGLDPIR